jgi:hypothetical protein
MKRYIATLIIGVLLICALPIGATAAERPSFTSEEEWQVLRLTNNERRKEGLQGLSTFASLNAAAKVRARECEILFDHQRPNGTTCFTALSEAGINYWYAGENIAAGHTDPAHVNQGWMNSEGHRENILTGLFKHLGAGYYYSPNSYYRKYWSQFFIGGCHTTRLLLEGEQPLFNAAGVLLNDPILTVVCDMHGKTYMPLSSATLTYLGDGKIRATHDGVSTTLQGVSKVFDDVAPDAWYGESVEYVYDLGLMQGIGQGKFAPDKIMTRAELVTVLYRLEGYEVAGDDGFSDVAPGDWYYNAVKWAAKEGYAYGVGGGKFAPNKTVTRAEMAAILFRFHTSVTEGPIAQSPLFLFPDAAQVPSWADEALQWAVAEGLISGAPQNGKTYLLPNGQTTRAQMASILMRYHQL